MQAAALEVGVRGRLYLLDVVGHVVGGDALLEGALDGSC